MTRLELDAILSRLIVYLNDAVSIYLRSSIGTSDTIAQLRNIQRAIIDLRDALSRVVFEDLSGEAKAAILAQIILGEDCALRILSGHQLSQGG